MFRIIFFLFITSFVFSQEEQAWVFFTPKAFESSMLETPADFLTTKAVVRKERHGIAIDERDLPLDEANINTLITGTGVTYITQSKWFNGIYVKGLESSIRALTSFDFVDSVFFMDRSLNGNSGAKKLKSNKGNNIDKFAQESTFNYGNTSVQINQINLPPLHNAGFSGEGMTIAVLDSGFENVDIIQGFQRARTNGKILGGYDFPNRTDAIFEYKNSDHGTSVLSCMAGFVEDQFVGTAPDASYYLFRTEIAERESPEEEALWIAAAERADSLGVDVLNTSLGYTTFDEAKYNYSPSDMNGQTTFISQGVNIALKKGMIPVTSAGNTGNDSWRIVSAPADSPAAFSIGAVNSSGTKASFSAFGPTADNRIKPDVVAMGQGTTVFNDQGIINTSNGTSFSGPIVAGAVACLWQAFPNATPQEIMDLVRSSASQFNSPDNNLGYGIADFGAAYNGSLSVEDFTQVEIQEGQDLISTLVDVYLQINERLIGSVINVFDLQGRLVFETEALSSRIEVEALQEGVYIFQNSSNDKATLFIKN